MSKRSLGFESESSEDENDTNFSVNPARKATKRPVTNVQRPYLQQPTKTKEEEDEEQLDESIYAYDEVYEDVSHAKRTENIRKARPAGPQYIGGLIDARNRRKEDKLRVSDLKVSKERELEGDEFKDKEVFVTTAYKEHREKAAIKQTTERAEEEEEEAAAATVGMKEFHRAMLNEDDSQGLDSLKGTDTLHTDHDDQKDTPDISQTTPKVLQAGLNITSKSSAPSKPWQPYKKQKPSRQSETDHIMKEIEQMERKKQLQKANIPQRSRLLPKLSDEELKAYKTRYLQRRAALT